MEKSCALMPSIVKLPKPGIPKKDSVTKLPKNNVGITTTTPVKIGLKPLGNKCLNKIANSETPLARAVRI
mgnify:CR=1 FL=1